MAVHLAVLILLVLPGLADAAGALPSCLRCHPSHYADQADCIGCHLGDDRTVRKDIAHLNLIPGQLLRYRVGGNSSVEEGRQLLERSACRRCHRVNGTGNLLAADLDRLAGRHPVALLQSITRPVFYMPDFGFNAEDAVLLVNAVLSSVQTPSPSLPKRPVTVRFTAASGSDANVFEQKCGACHKLLTATHGGLGRGISGPNLSGLFTAFYPQSYGNGGRWTNVHLEKWLKNPRQSRPLARMQPVNLSLKESGQLLETFRASAASAKSRASSPIFVK